MAREYENRCAIIDIRQLMHEFESDRLAIEADWMEWLKKTSYQLLKQSPNPVIFACSIVAEVFNSLAQDLYNVAFLTIWRVLND